MGKFNSIEEINIWKQACRLSIFIYKISEIGKFARDFSLRDQMRRAAISIASNIAEGFERQGNKEFARFLYIAKGSAGELRTQVYIVHKLGYISNKDYLEVIKECKLISRKISSLITYLKKH